MMKLLRKYNNMSNSKLNQERSKKFKNNTIDKTKLWNIFDTEINEEKNKPLECIYRSCGNREKCDCCEYSLAFSEEGYLTCINPKCGIIYKDIVDQSAEWRYYGADDSQILQGAWFA